MSSGPPPVPGGRTPEEREAARRARAARREPGPTAGMRSDGRRPPASEPAARGRLPRTALLAGAALLSLLVAWFALSLLQPLKGRGEGRLRVVVPKGAGVGEIGDLLERREVVASSFFFGLRARLSGHGGDLKPGAYALRRDMSYGAVLDALAAGPPHDVVAVTIPEGRSRREVARLLPAGLEGDYFAATRRSRALDPREYGAPAGASLEGFLFPATYEFTARTTAQQLVARQLEAFHRNWKKVDLAYARSKNLTPYDVLIIASLVEEETLAPDERPLVASVIYNRLKAGMTLGIDATIRYGLGVPPTESLRRSQLESDHPYNTRKRYGLTPTPITNPGLASMQAAAHPAKTNYLYFVRKPDKVHHFFTADVDEFNAYLARHGYGTG